MSMLKPVAAALAVASLLAACGGGDSTTDGASYDLSGAPGSLIASPSAMISLTPADFQAAAPATLFLVAGVPKCTVTFNYFQYGTVGGAGEKTTASGGIMVPSGADAACTGPRPVLLYAHGTTTNKNKNMASPADNEAALVAAMYAAQGYIVVAPNYAGYEASTLSYHPYVNLEQQAKDVVDALTAARKGFAAVGASANSKLFVSGYSQGGFVSMAAQRALQLAGTPVTAGAHLSGPYALASYVDANFAGRVGLGATVFAPLLSTSFQRAYGNIYASPEAMYEATFSSGIETLLPSTTPIDTLFSTGKLPATFMFEGAAPDPRLAIFFGTPNLVKTDYRQAVLADAMTHPTTPQHPLRVAASKNDLLKQNWTPTQPMLLCGGNADPTVFFDVNTQGAKTYFNGKSVPDPMVKVLDVDSAFAGDGFDTARGGFAQAKAAAGDASTVLRDYHGTLVPPFCNAAARGYFNNFLTSPSASAS
ncbi:alpha/beta hydrolase [Hydrogenophaga sp.]|uniref:alpha/beta hydrolase n=1 Tax=Hydrogenophaga sp. TaxID=1904254 RepID=UPI00286D8860|nr:lipase family protein [Hydrogenophaga sp.]